MRVWIDQDLCTGGGLCEDSVPDVFFGDSLYFVKEAAEHFGTETLFDGTTNPAGSKGRARLPDSLLAQVAMMAEDCPGDCIFITDDE